MAIGASRSASLVSFTFSGTDPVGGAVVAVVVGVLTIGDPSLAHPTSATSAAAANNRFIGTRPG
jgi:hypothetical protein